MKNNSDLIDPCSTLPNTKGEISYVKSLTNSELKTELDKILQKNKLFLSLIVNNVLDNKEEDVSNIISKNNSLQA